MESMTLDEALTEECEHGCPKVMVCPKCNPEIYEAEMPHVLKIVEELEKRKEEFESRGICPRCEGHKLLRTTRYNPERVTSMEPCSTCGGTGIYKE